MATKSFWDFDVDDQPTKKSPATPKPPAPVILAAETAQQAIGTTPQQPTRLPSAPTIADVLRLIKR